MICTCICFLPFCLYFFSSLSGTRPLNVLLLAGRPSLGPLWVMSTLWTRACVDVWLNASVNTQCQHPGTPPQKTYFRTLLACPQKYFRTLSGPSRQFVPYAADSPQNSTKYIQTPFSYALKPQPPLNFRTRHGFSYAFSYAVSYALSYAVSYALSYAVSCEVFFFADTARPRVPHFVAPC